jgi:hypothetical protein
MPETVGHSAPESGDNGADSDDEEDGNNLRDQVNSFIDSEDIECDIEDGPGWMFDEEETLVKDPKYVFCPAAHRKQALHLVAKHFCEHPFFPDSDGSKTAEQIRRNAVFEMYDYCVKRGLRELWGYLWANWYSPKMWKLWARSTSALLTRLRTTMTVENFWKILKHDYLHNVPRLRLDQLVWIIIYKLTPRYYAQLEIMSSDHRLGRSKPLTTQQRYFKKQWLTLRNKPISGRRDYHTDVGRWTCQCG